MSGKQNQDKSGTEQHLNKQNIPRRSILAALGIGGVGLLSGPVQASSDSSQNPIYNWEQDVEANGHNLSELGSMSMAANSDAITKFAGENLSVDNGTLNASTSGIAKSGEKVLLSTVDLNDERVFFVTEDYRGFGMLRAVPFGQLSYENISQLYVSIIGTAEGFEGSPPVYVRLYDRSSGTPIEETEVKVDSSDDSVFAFEGPQVAYDPAETTILELHGKSKEGNADESIFSGAVNVWGEMA